MGLLLTHYARPHTEILTVPEARVDPKHPDHADVAEWLDGYDPEELDVFPIEVALGRIAARRNAAAKRIIKPAND